MSGFDIGRQFTTAMLPGQGGEDSAAFIAGATYAQVEATLYDFLHAFRINNDYLYRDRLRANLAAKQYVLEVALEHVQLWNQVLAQALRERPAEILPLVCVCLAGLYAARTTLISDDLHAPTVRVGAPTCSSAHPLPHCRGRGDREA